MHDVRAHVGALFTCLTLALLTATAAAQTVSVSEVLDATGAGVLACDDPASTGSCDYATANAGYGCRQECTGPMSCMPSAPACCAASEPDVTDRYSLATLSGDTTLCLGPAGELEPYAVDYTSAAGLSADATRALASLEARRQLIDAAEWLKTSAGATPGAAFQPAELQAPDYCSSSAFVPAYTCADGGSLNGTALSSGSISGCGVGAGQGGTGARNAQQCSGSECEAIPLCLTAGIGAAGPLGVCPDTTLCDPDDAANQNSNAPSQCNQNGAVGRVCVRTAPGANAGMCVTTRCQSSRDGLDTEYLDYGLVSDLTQLNVAQLGTLLDEWLESNYANIGNELVTGRGDDACGDINDQFCRVADPAFWNLNKVADDFYEAWQSAQGTDYVIVLDRSGSMAWADSGPSAQQFSSQTSRIERARDAIKLFTGLIGKTQGHRIALASFASTAAAASAWYDVNGSFDPGSTAGGTFGGALAAVTAGGATSIGAGLNAARAAINARTGASAQRPTAIILLTDGRQNTAPCATLRDGSTTSSCTNTTNAFTRGSGPLDIPLSTNVCAVAIGSESDVDEPMLKSIANPGAFFSTNEEKGSPGGSLAGALAKCVRELGNEYLALDPRSYLPRGRVALAPESYDSCGDEVLSFSAEWGSKEISSGPDMRLLVNAPNGDLIVPTDPTLESSAKNMRVISVTNPLNSTYRMQVTRDTNRVVNGWAPDSYADADQTAAVALVRRQIQRLCPDGCNDVLYFEDGAAPANPVESAYKLALDAELASGLLGTVTSFVPTWAANATASQINAAVASAATNFGTALAANPSVELVVFAQKRTSIDSVFTYDTVLSSHLCASTSAALLYDARAGTGGAPDLGLNCSGALARYNPPPPGVVRQNYTELRDPEGLHTMLDDTIHLVSRGRSVFSYPVAAFPFDQLYANVSTYGANIAATQVELGQEKTFAEQLTSGYATVLLTYGSGVTTSLDMPLLEIEINASDPTFRDRAAREVTTGIQGQGVTDVRAIEGRASGTTLHAGLRVLPWTRPATGYGSVQAEVRLTRPTESLTTALQSTRACTAGQPPLDNDGVGGTGRTINQADIAKQTLAPVALMDDGSGGDLYAGNLVFEADIPNAVQFEGTYDLDYTIRLELTDVQGNTCTQTRAEHVTQYLGQLVETSNLECPAPSSLFDEVQQPPVVSVSDVGPVPVCGATTATVALNASASAGVLTGRVIGFAPASNPTAFQAVNGQTIPSGNQDVLLPVGVSKIEWIALDGLLSGRAEQLVTITAGNDADGACCPAGYSVVSGNNWGNWLSRFWGAHYCMVGKGGNDYLQPGLYVLDNGDDYLFGGSGNDNLQCTGPNSRCFGGTGNDQLYGFAGGIEMWGGAGNDVLFELHDSVFYGGPGNDTVAGLFGNNTIVPGSGFDVVTGGFGDDTVVIYDACELVPGEVMDGGFGGNDTLVSPLTPSELLAAGVVAAGFENFVLDTSRRYLADCF